MKIFSVRTWLALLGVGIVVIAGSTALAVGAGGRQNVADYGAAAIHNAPFPHPFGHRRHAFRDHFVFWLDAAASALKITPAELRQDFAKGMTLHQIADSKHVTRDQFAAAVKASLTQKLDQAVQNGRITKEKETKILARVDQLITKSWDRSLAQRKRP